MQDQIGYQGIPVRVFRSADRLTVAAPMPGLEPEDISVEVTEDGLLKIEGALRGAFKDVNEVLMNEWSVGPFYRELSLPIAVNGELANVTLGNGVLVVALPLADQTRPAKISLEHTGLGRGQRVGHTGNTIQPTTTEQHQSEL